MEKKIIQTYREKKDLQHLEIIEKKNGLRQKHKKQSERLTIKNMLIKDRKPELKRQRQREKERWKKGKLKEKKHLKL